MTAVYTELWEGETGTEAQQILRGESACSKYKGGSGQLGWKWAVRVVVGSLCGSGKIRVVVVSSDKVRMKLVK